MNRTTYRPRRATASEKAAAWSFQKPDAGFDEAEGEAALQALRKAAFAARENEQERAAFAAKMDREMASIGGPRIPANPAVEAVDPQRWPAVDATLPDRPPLRDPAAFALAGNAIFTVVSKATGTRFTYRVRQPEADKPHFVSVLTGPDNESSYTYLGTIFSDGTYRHGKRSSIGPDAPSAKAATWFFTNLHKPEAMAKCTVHHEGRCCRCGRRLTVPSSIESGIGPECAKR